MSMECTKQQLLHIVIPNKSSKKQKAQRKMTNELRFVSTPSDSCPTSMQLHAQSIMKNSEKQELIQKDTIKPS